MRTPSAEEACYEVPWEFTCHWNGRPQHQVNGGARVELGGAGGGQRHGHGDRVNVNKGDKGQSDLPCNYYNPSSTGNLHQQMKSAQVNRFNRHNSSIIGNGSPALGVSAKIRSHSHSASPSCSSNATTSTSTTSSHPQNAHQQANGGQSRILGCIRAPQSDSRPPGEYDAPWDVLKAHRQKQPTSKKQRHSGTATNPSVPNSVGLAILQTETIQSPIAAVRLLTGTGSAAGNENECLDRSVHWTPPLSSQNSHLNKSTLSSSSSGRSSASSARSTARQCVTTAFCNSGANSNADAMKLSANFGGGQSFADRESFCNERDKEIREMIIQKIASGIALTLEETQWLSKMSLQNTNSTSMAKKSGNCKMATAKGKNGSLKPHVIQVNSTVDRKMVNFQVASDRNDQQEIIYDQVPDEDQGAEENIVRPSIRSSPSQRSFSHNDAISCTSTTPTNPTPLDTQTQPFSTSIQPGSANRNSFECDKRPVDEYDVPWEFRARRVLRNGAGVAEGNKGVLQMGLGKARARSVERPGSDPKCADSQSGSPSNQSKISHLSRNQLSLNLGCNSLNPVPEEFDPDLPLRRQGWYHGNITRGEAENRLQGKVEGSYLVRLCETNKNEYALSLKSAKGYMHMKIQPSDQPATAQPPAGADVKALWVLGYFSQPFERISDMIRYYSINKLPIKGADHMCLLHPVNEPLL